LTSDEGSRLRSAATPSVALGLICLALHLAVNGRYHIFRDELYFIVCGQHPALGYVDQPPLVPLIAAGFHALFGANAWALRLVPALAMAATTALAAEYTRLIGGGRFAQWLCGLAVLCAPVLLVDGLLLTTDCLQALTWLACAWCLTRVAQTGEERWWLGFGLAVGISLTAKYLILFFLASLAVGVVATPLRRSLTRPWIYLGALIAFLFLAPSLYWQAENGWPFLELGRAAAGKNIALSPLAFLGQQALFMLPPSAAIWLAGLWRFSVRPLPPALRAFPIAFVVMQVLVYLLHGKAYYLAAFYPILFAGGALAIEGWIARPILRGVVAAGIAITGVVIAPIALPILPPQDYAAYAHTLGMSSKASAMEKGAASVLPQYLADMFGWREMAEKVSAAYNALPPEERAKAVFFGRNYGEAAALDVYGAAFNGPPAISGHNNYYLWGPRGFNGSVVIMVGDTARIAPQFDSVTQVGEIDSPYAMPYETNIPISILRGLHVPLAEVWPKLKHYE
jgi:hypothetical protein